MASPLERRVIYMNGLLHNYLDFCDQSRPENNQEHKWDMVVISTGDAGQKEFCEWNLEDRRQSGSLPVGIEFRVFSDPEGVRCGEGGATLYILHELNQELGEALYSKKILLIHAGGFSKRLPNHSGTSKVFCPVPIDGSGFLMQLLDLKLLDLWPFLELMTPGVFVTTSDDWVGLNIEEQDFFKMHADIRRNDDQEPHLYALAYPSCLEVGKDHGVFHLLEKPDMDQSAFLLSKCGQYLQKPSIKLMKSIEGLVLTNANNDEFVFTDSPYWFNSALTRQFVKLYGESSKVPGEISIYHDFMPCQGVMENKHHVEKIRANPGTDPMTLLKKRICDVMENVDLSLIALMEAQYYHTGTSIEYVHWFSTDAQLAMELQFGKVILSKLLGCQMDSIHGIVMHSIIATDLLVPSNVIIEYSRVESSDIILVPNTILSHCHVDMDFSGVIPGNFLYHTRPIIDPESGETAFVTIAVNMDEDLKVSYPNLSQIQFDSKTIADIFGPDISRDQVLDEGSDFKTWTLKIFPRAKSQAESFVKTHKLITGARSYLEEPRYSLDQLMRIEDKKEIFRTVKELKLNILEN